MKQSPSEKAGPPRGPVSGKTPASTSALVLLLLLLLPAYALAGPQVGTLTNSDGAVQIYSHPSKDQVDGPPPHARLEGIYYSVADAHVGDRLENGNILRTQVGAHARLIYDNGDQFYVAPATSFRVAWEHDAEDGKPELELRYGKSRFVIAKGGPRSRFVIRTKTAVMGVRGTDFFVAVNDESGATETATLRGAVQVESKTTPGAQPTLVSTGETASVAPAPPVASGAPPSAPPPVETHKTTQEELHAIQRNSEVKAPVEIASPEVANKVKELETAAVHSTLKDIRTVNAALADKLEAQSQGGAAPIGVETLNQAVVATLEADAPKSQSALGPIADVSIETGGKKEMKTDAEPGPGSQEERPESRRSGFRLLRGELSGIAVAQNGGADSQSAELAWTPRYQFGGWGWLGWRGGASFLKATDGTFLMLESALFFGVRIYGPMSAELFAGGQGWISHGGGPEFGFNLVWFPENRTFGIVERWFVGATHVAGSQTYNESSNPYGNLNATILRAGVGL